MSNQHFSLEISGQIPTPVDVPRDTVVKSRGGRRLMVLTARFRPGPTFMQGNDRSRFHLKGLQRAAYQMPVDKKTKARPWSVASLPRSLQDSLVISFQWLCYRCVNLGCVTSRASMSDKLDYSFACSSDIPGILLVFLVSFTRFTQLANSPSDQMRT